MLRRVRIHVAEFLCWHFACENCTKAPLLLSRPKTQDVSKYLLNHAETTLLFLCVGVLESAGRLAHPNYVWISDYHLVVFLGSRFHYPISFFLYLLIMTVAPFRGPGIVGFPLLLSKSMGLGTVAASVRPRNYRRYRPISQRARLWSFHSNAAISRWRT